MTNSLCIVHYGGFMVTRFEIGSKIGQDFPLNASDWHFLPTLSHFWAALGKLALQLLYKSVDRFLDWSRAVDRTC